MDVNLFLKKSSSETDEADDWSQDYLTKQEINGIYNLQKGFNIEINKNNNSNKDKNNNIISKKNINKNKNIIRKKKNNKSSNLIYRTDVE